jgi:hypothetical protein
MATVITNTDIGSNLFIGFTKLNAREQVRGINYRIVYANNTPENNAIEFYNAYQFAKIQNPNAQPKSATNRFVLFLAPGVYSFNLGFPTTIDLDTPFVDIVSLSGEADVVITTQVGGTSPITVSTSDIRLKGINLNGQDIQINSSYSNNYFENIIGGEGNFSNPSTTGGDIAGNFKNCVGGDYSFGDADYGQAVLFSTFENCSAGEWSFGFDVSDSNFKNCTSGFSSFGVNTLTTCILTDCQSTLGDCFGVNTGITNSTLTNCSAGSYSFGRTNGNSSIINSKLTNCTALDNSFSNNISSSTFLNCKAGVSSFALTSDVNTVSSISDTTFTNCKAADYSFGVRNTGDVTFTDCTAGIESFGADQANGLYKNCTAGINSFGAGTQGWSDLIAGGKFYNCIAIDGSFGTNFANGQFYNCISQANTTNGWPGIAQGGMGGFAMGCNGMNPTGLGTAIYCTDGLSNPVNFGLASTTNNI